MREMLFKAVLAGDKSTFSVTVTAEEAVTAGAATDKDDADSDEAERFSRGGVVMVRETSAAGWGGGTLSRWLLLELGVVFTVVWIEEALE